MVFPELFYLDDRAPNQDSIYLLTYAGCCILGINNLFVYELL